MSHKLRIHCVDVIESTTRNSLLTSLSEVVAISKNPSMKVSVGISDFGNPDEMNPELSHTDLYGTSVSMNFFSDNPLETSSSFSCSVDIRIDDILDRESLEVVFHHLAKFSSSKVSLTYFTKDDILCIYEKDGEVEFYSARAGHESI